MALPALLPRRQVSYQDLKAVPAHLVAEIIDGELVAMPRPSSRHALAASALMFRVGPSYHDGTGGPGGWWILDEPELHLGSHVIVPDLAGWRRDRLPGFPDVPFFKLAPDWACEVVSPSTERFDRGKKLRIYARARVPWVWLLSPLARTLEVLRLERGAYRITAVHSGEVTARVEPFPALKLDLPALWGEPTPRAPARRSRVGRRRPRVPTKPPRHRGPQPGPRVGRGSARG